MKQLFIFVFLLLTGSEIYPQKFSELRNNVVQITTKFSTGEPNFGYGIVVAEKDSMLYLVTANHVVQKEVPDTTTQTIETRFYFDVGNIVTATILNTSSQYDFALLKVRKPNNYTFVVECLSDFAYGDQVWYIGKSKEWYIPTDTKTGTIITERKNPQGTIKAEGMSVQPGTSGAPMLNQNKIVGMIIRASVDEEVEAIEMKVIADIILNSWRYPFQLTQVTKGLFSDQRDEQNPVTYKWCRIGEDIWMAENLKFKSLHSYCYRDDNRECDGSGRLYQWIDISSVCPKGWKVPSKNEFEKLLSVRNSFSDTPYDQLIEGGSSEFTAKFAGWRSLGGNYNNFGDATYFWSCDPFDGKNAAWALKIDGNSSIAEPVKLNRTCALSVRCIKIE